MKTINTTLRIEPEQVNKFEDWLRSHFKVIDYKILPDTEVMYNEDPKFQELVKMVKSAQKVRDKYINEHNQKFLTTH